MNITKNKIAAAALALAIAVMPRKFRRKERHPQHLCPGVIGLKHILRKRRKQVL